MIGALEVVARLCALGLGLDKEAITSLMHEGPHLLAPTGEGTRSLSFKVQRVPVPYFVFVMKRSPRACGLWSRLRRGPLVTPTANYYRRSTSKCLQASRHKATNEAGCMGVHTSTCMISVRCPLPSGRCCREQGCVLL